MGTLWKDQLPNALRAYRIAYKTPLGMSPYQLVYGKTCHLPVDYNIKITRLSKDGIWTSKPLDRKEKCNYQN